MIDYGSDIRPPDFEFNPDHPLGIDLRVAYLGQHYVDQNEYKAFDTSPFQNHALHVGSASNDYPHWQFSGELNRPMLHGFGYYAAANGPAIQLDRAITFANDSPFTISAWTARNGSAGYHAAWGGGSNNSRVYGFVGTATARLVYTTVFSQDYYNIFYTSNEWYHICVTYDGGTFLFYRDGILKGSPLVQSTSGGGLSYFGANNAQAYTWNGKLADCMAWERCLSQPEVWTLANRRDPMLGGLLIPPRRSSFVVPAQVGGITAGEIAEALTLTDAWTSTKTVNATVLGGTELILFTDTWEVISLYSKVVEEAVTFTDAWTATAIQTAEVAEGITFTDTWAAEVSQAVAISEGLTFGDTWAATAVAAASVLEAITFTDALNATADAVALVSEGITFTDTYATSGPDEGSIAEAITFTDSWSATLSSFQEISEGLEFGDAVTSAIQIQAEIDEALTFTDTEAATAQTSVEIDESLTFGDTNNGIAVTLAQIQENIVFGDTWQTGDYVACLCGRINIYGRLSGTVNIYGRLDGTVNFKCYGCCG